MSIPISNRASPCLTALAQVQDKLDKIAAGIGQHTLVAHAAAPTPAAWKTALASASGAPAAYAVTKTLVFKPKTAKGAVPVPVVVVAAGSQPNPVANPTSKRGPDVLMSSTLPQNRSRPPLSFSRMPPRAYLLIIDRFRVIGLS